MVCFIVEFAQVMHKAMFCKHVQYACAPRMPDSPNFEGFFFLNNFEAFLCIYLVVWLNNRNISL